MELLVHNVEIRVFTKKEKNEGNIENGLRSLVPFDISDEQIEIQKKSAKGFEDKDITILELSISKRRHVNAFLKLLLKRLGDEQKELILRQADSRLDDELYFFIRLDKDALLNDYVWRITDRGNCYHIRLAIAAFPAKRDIALKKVRELFH
ncbi:MAG: RNA-binding domain-containing protein [Candidatus Nanoarchaeia archaeon]